MDPLTNEDVADILALLDSLPYDEFDLETPRFRLSLRRTPGGWTQSTEIHAGPKSLAAPKPLAAPENAAPKGAAVEGRGTLPPSTGGRGTQPPVTGGGAFGGRGTQPSSSGGSGTQPPVDGGEARPGEVGGAGEVGAGEVGAGEVGAGEVGAGEVGGAEEEDGELVAVRAPLPGTFYRAPRPGAAPFAEVGSRVG